MSPQATATNQNDIATSSHAQCRVLTLAQREIATNMVTECVAACRLRHPKAAMALARCREQILRDGNVASIILVMASELQKIEQR